MLLGDRMNCELLRERLAEAQDAYHQLALGRSVVEVRDSNGEMVKYSQASIRLLTTYIASLERQLGLSAVLPPMGVRF